MKNVLIASDSFKGTLSSARIADIFEEVANENYPDIKILKTQIADGGEGSVSAVLASGLYSPHVVDCSNPIFEKVKAVYAMKNDVAVVEMAAASGLTLIEYKEGNALITSSYGTGEMVCAAIARGAKKVFLCVGGSATNDGGIGALSAMGFRFLDKYGNELKPIGQNLCAIEKVDTSVRNRYADIEFILVCDVDNPLLGKGGATLYYGKQKGASGACAEILESGMKNFAKVTLEATGADVAYKKGAGAAGGMAAGFMAYLGAKTQSGIESILDLIGFDDMLKRADAVVTGEGRLDKQSLHGKAVCGVCKRAKERKIDTYAICGYTTLKSSEYTKIGLKHIETLIENADSVDDSIKNSETYAKLAAKKLLDVIGGKRQ